MIRKPRVRRSDAEWLDLIKECRASGYSDRSWCGMHGIPDSSFYSAVKRLRKQASVQIPESPSLIRDTVQQIVPLTIIDDDEISDMADTMNSIGEPAAEQYQSPAVTLKVNGFSLGIHNHAEKDVIRNTLRALQELC